MWLRPADCGLWTASSWSWEANGGREPQQDIRGAAERAANAGNYYQLKQMVPVVGLLPAFF